MSKNQGQLRKQQEFTEQHRKESAHNILEDHLSFASCMIDPSEFAQAANLAPSLVPSRVSTVVESFTKTFGGPGGTIGDFVAEARPLPFGTLSLTAEPDSDADVAQPISGTYIALTGVTSTTANYNFPFMGIQSETLAGDPLRSAGSADSVAPLPLNRQVLPVNSTAGGTARISVSNSTQACLVVFSAYTAAGAETQVSVYVPQGGGGESAITLPGGTVFVGFGHAKAFTTAKVCFDWALIPGAALYRLHRHGEISNLSTLSDVKNLRWWRIVGQTLRVTYSGSLLNCGGKIAAAEVYKDFRPEGGMDMYTAISRLPANMRYTGPVKDGAHVFLRPASVEMYEPQLYGAGFIPDSLGMKRLVVAGSLDDPTQTVTVEVLTIVQFMSDAPAYASSEWTRPWHGWDTVLLALAQINPASENPEHLKKIKKFMSRKVKEALRYAIANPGEMVSTVAKLAAMLA